MEHFESLQLFLIFLAVVIGIVVLIFAWIVLPIMVWTIKQNMRDLRVSLQHIEALLLEEAAERRVQAARSVPKE